jgi:hypothetical protein
MLPWNTGFHSHHLCCTRETSLGCHFALSFLSHDCHYSSHHSWFQHHPLIFARPLKLTHFSGAFYTKSVHGTGFNDSLQARSDHHCLVYHTVPVQWMALSVCIFLLLSLLSYQTHTHTHTPSYHHHFVILLANSCPIMFKWFRSKTGKKDLLWILVLT